jgi:hypothetical protein
MSREYGGHSHICGTCGLYVSAKDTGEWLFRLHFTRNTKVEGRLTSSCLQQFMAFKNTIGSRKFRNYLESGKKEDIEYILAKIRGALGAFRDLDSTGTPRVNKFLTTIINNVEKQWRHSQDVWNAANSND